MTVDTEQVKYIQKLVADLKEAQRKIEELEDDIKVLKANKKEIEEVIIPEVMVELGVSSVQLLTKEVVTVKPYYFARLPEDTVPFFDWLRKNNFGGLIKEKAELYPDTDMMELVLEFLKEFKMNHEILSTIHWKTLEAWFKECVEGGLLKILPLDLFKNYVGRKATVKSR